jgi:hypothetical protein
MLPFDNYYAQPAPPRPIYQLPPKPIRPAPPKPVPVVRIDLPPPDALDITIQDPPVTVPSPDVIGIRLDRP